MKITLATFKKFCKDNKENLYFKKCSSFDGMIDCVTDAQDAKEIKVADYTDLTDMSMGGHVKLGWLVGHSRDYFEAIPNGINVCNSCGSYNVYTK